MPDTTAGGQQFGDERPLERDCVRIVSWNIERGLRFPKILEFLRSCEADLLLLQEVDLNARRTKYRDIACELGQALKFNYAFGMEFQELAEGTATRPAFHGMATLSPWPLSNVRIIRFRRQSAFWKPRWYVPDLAIFQRRLGGRMALVAEATIYGRKMVTYNLHLESRGNDSLRLHQLNEVLTDFRRYAERPTVVIGGDFNFNAGEGEGARFLSDAGFRDAVHPPGRLTPTALGPGHHEHRIDWIFISDPVDSQGRVHNDIHASDHFPISATFPRTLATF
jgi:endonuclease/exonuclease/phosphatase family metal-dependent hydrolase